MTGFFSAHVYFFLQPKKDPHSGCCVIGVTQPDGNLMRGEVRVGLGWAGLGL